MTGFRAILQHLKSENGKGKYQNMKNRKEFNLGGDKKNLRVFAEVLTKGQAVGIISCLVDYHGR